MNAQAATEAAAGEELLLLAGRLGTADGFERIVEFLGQRREATIDGAWGSSRALAAAALAHRSSGPVLVVCPHAADIDAFADDLSLFTRAAIEKFPAWEAEPGERVLHDEIYGDRLRLLKLLEQGLGAGGWGLGNSDVVEPVASLAPKIIVTSIQSLLQPAPLPSRLARDTRRLRVGDELDVNDLLAWLVERGFHATSAVELPGEFASRGGILDIFAPDWYEPVRIELFGDTIESIRRFDVAGQRSLAALDAVDVTMLSGSAPDREHLSIYLPADTWTLLVEPGEIDEQARHFLERVEDPQAYHSATAVMAELFKFGCASMESVSVGTGGVTSHVAEAYFRLPVESVERLSGDINRVRTELDIVGRGQKVAVVCRTDAEAERLAEVFADTRLAGEGAIRMVVGHLHAGFRLVRERLVLLSGGELFQRAEIDRPSRRRLGRAIDSFLDLNEGDLIVHLAHGIGRYRGLKMLEKADGHAEEHLEVEFDEGTRIFVPASKINLVQKYIGGTKTRPRLAKIGGATWLKQKKAAEQAVVDLAVDMLDLQAARAARPGIAFAPDTSWQREFDAAFPYRETPDQLVAIDAIKADMQRARSMDRLLCGDVGFGKTEVAMRAVFKAVENGYQAAILAPTTVLVEQHYRTLSARMAAFPFTIARLSRFCTDKEQRDAVAGLAAGGIDIVVGTHRLASVDVSFFNLGLVVIDEEQRFGVEVKEKLKTLRQTVDVLTMTATPIPRTLHMSLLGVRDISNLETPPDDRIAVETRVTRFDETIVRHAVLRELSREGQVYFVHNRIADIESVAQRLREIVPEAKIVIGHGQMPEGKLERVMLDFVEKKYDILLATTIIESGLDIPNANTIFIDDADRYGLADLHQLRGRVGRYKHRAYCYLLVDPRKHLSPVAARRLRAIEEFSRLGSGFAIAMRDLEIRGAGNLLGTQQSGHIAAVGYELYCQLLDQAVRRLKQMPLRESPEVNVDLPVEAFFPREYVGDMRLKIDLYRRLGRIAAGEELADFRAELLDRFGPIPDPVERLLSLVDLRLAAARWRIEQVHVEDRYLVLTYRWRAKIDELAKKSRGRLRVVDERSAYLPLADGIQSSEQVLSAAKALLQLT
ncbi:MAG: transcription-repair coupling factor [Planctomycetota bacterium]|nr:MAG: transcription-repair coupling factor [Planctomycetota bacterium]